MRQYKQSLTRVGVLIGTLEGATLMRVVNLAELHAFLPQSAEVVTPAALTKSCALPRRNPFSSFSAILGGMVDALNAAILDACPTPDCVLNQLASVDYSEWITCPKLIDELYALVIRQWPEAKMEGMKISISIPPLKASIKLAETA